MDEAFDTARQSGAPELPPNPAPIQAVCPACKATTPVESSAGWWRCSNCGTYVRNMVCPSTSRIVRVHSKKKKAVPFVCPQCGSRHTAIAIKDGTRVGLTREQLEQRQAGQLKPNLAALPGPIRESIQANLEPGETVEVVIVGEGNQTLVGTGRRAFIAKQGILTGGFFKKLSTSWDYRNISGVEVQRSMSMTGVILQVPGVSPITQSGRFSKGPGSVWEAPNAIVARLSPTMEASVARLRELVAEHQRAQATAVVQHQDDSLDQLKKLAELRDAGVITEEEFGSKKKKLLDQI
jgi:predicted RNA-binding Zn-ribbon protein involved in translation (DUF1610 family)